MSTGLDPSEALLDLTVAEVRPLSSHITAFRLRHPDRRALPGYLAGAHIKVRVEIDGQARWRHYSLINPDAAADASERPSEYLIAVRREDAALGGRGGSLYMHTQLKAGDMPQVSSPINGFRLDPAHDNVVLIAGGIGVTPIISMATALRTAGKRYAMHYSGRSADQLALAPELQGVAADALTLYADDDEAPARSGHVSQVPNKGDFYATDVARQPVIMVRHQDDSVRVMMNRCAHKGARLVSDICGNTGKFFRCPYHAWTYKTDGSLLAIPLKNAYEKTGLSECQSSKGLALVANMEIYRGFVFVRFAQEGPSFNEYFGDSLSSIDNMADRSPEGELEIAGGCLRYLHNCNWKMFVENLNDTMHPMVVHESSAGTAKKLWEGKPADAPRPMAIEQFVPFMSDYKFFDDMGVRVFDNGHRYSGVNFSIHSNYAAIPEYDAAMLKTYGEEGTRKILGTSRHNTVYYPSLTIKGAIQSIRVVRPLGPDKTLVESWTFRLKGAPDKLLQRTLMYSRLINSPMSVVGHDDLHAYRAIQEGLQASGNDWVSLHRDFDPAEIGQKDMSTKGTSEISMRNQFRAWRKYMTPKEG